MKVSLDKLCVSAWYSSDRKSVVFDLYWQLYENVYGQVPVRGGKV